MDILDWILIIVIAGGAAGLLYRSLRRGGACAGCGNCTCGRGKSPAGDGRPADRQDLKNLNSIKGKGVTA